MHPLLKCITPLYFAGPPHSRLLFSNLLQLLPLQNLQLQLFFADQPQTLRHWSHMLQLLLLHDHHRANAQQHTQSQLHTLRPPTHIRLLTTSPCLRNQSLRSIGSKPWTSVRQPGRRPVPQNKNLLRTASRCWTTVPARVADLAWTRIAPPGERQLLMTQACHLPSGLD